MSENWYKNNEKTADISLTMGKELHIVSVCGNTMCLSQLLLSEVQG